MIQVEEACCVPQSPLIRAGNYVANMAQATVLECRRFCSGISSITDFEGVLCPLPPQVAVGSRDPSVCGHLALGNE